jgi:hypothetical protein
MISHIAIMDFTSSSIVRDAAARAGSGKFPEPPLPEAARSGADIAKEGLAAQSLQPGIPRVFRRRSA